MTLSNTVFADDHDAPQTRDTLTNVRIV